MIANFLKGLTANRSAIAGAYDDLDLIREQIAEQRRVIDSIAAAPIPVAEAMEAFDAWLDAQATEAVDRLHPGSLLQRDRTHDGLALPMIVQRGEAFAYRDAIPATEVLLGLLIATNRAAFRTIIENQLHDLSGGREALTASERAKKAERAAAQLLDLEMVEERMIREMESAGLDVMRRADASPVVLLASDASLPS